MANIKEAWSVAPTGTTALTVTGLGTLANSASATSNVVDNYNGGANQFIDCILQVSIGSPTSGTSASGYLEIYLQPSLDNSTFSDSSNDILVDVMNINVNTTTFVKHTSLAKALQGVLPPYFRVRFNNQSGGTLASGTVVYNMLYYTVI
jgi:hypothetical protein